MKNKIVFKFVSNDKFMDSDIHICATAEEIIDAKAEIINRINTYFDDAIKQNSVPCSKPVSPELSTEAGMDKKEAINV